MGITGQIAGHSPVSQFFCGMFAAPPFVNLVVIRSENIDRAAVFYHVLGLLFTKHRHGTGPEHYSSEVAGFVFEIYPLASGQPPTTATRIGFSVDDVDSVVRSLEGIGAKTVSEPRDSEWGRRAVVKDLDGHTVELTTPSGRDVIVASVETVTGVMTKTHSDGMTPSDRDVR